MAPTQAAVEEDDEEEERTPQVCRRRSWASPSPPAQGTPAKRLSLRLWADINPELVY